LKIRRATTQDRNTIKELWIDFFGDPEEYIDFFLFRRYKEENCALLEENGEVIGMAHLLPCKIAPNFDALYWYAVGIRSDKRNQGYFRRFVTDLLKNSQKNGYYNVCMPRPGLEHVYQKFGFSYPYTASTIEFLKNECNFAEKIKITDAAPSDFSFLFEKQGSLVWDHNDTEYALLENEYCGGRNLKFEFQNQFYFATAIKKSDYFLIDNTNLNSNQFLQCAKSFFEVLQTEKIIFVDSTKEDTIIGLSDCNLVNFNSKISFTLA
jgi:N-acetylglutamate synthase-like GNAT family acetyltransferase